jgi:hypothetical protein
MMVGVAALALGPSAHAHNSKTTAVDELCSAIRHEFVEAEPRYFSGPNPWVGLNKLPDEYPDAALATVYSEGSRVVWVILQMAGPGNAWFETTNYFFDGTGLVRKRERHFEQPDANVAISEDTYFEERKVIKASYHHGTLRKGKEDWDNLYDPRAPDYTSTGDLPVSFVQENFKQLTQMRILSGLRTDRTSP